MDLYAWVGIDELGSGRVGIKQGRVPAGFIPLAAMDYDRAKLEKLAPAMQAQADIYGQTIRLARFTWVEDVMTLPPTTGN
jgi:hypothetical protein